MRQEDAPSITFQTRLPLAWENPGTPDEATLGAWRQENLTLLRALATLESMVPDKERELDQALGKAVERMEAKIDVMLTLMARLVGQQNSLPPSLPLTLAAQHVEWACPAAVAPPADSHVLLKVYPSPKLPEPLRLWVRVATQPARSQGEDCYCLAEFLDEDAEFEEWMTRTLFRYHRRALQARHQQ